MDDSYIYAAAMAGVKAFEATGGMTWVHMEPKLMKRLGHEVGSGRPKDKRLLSDNPADPLHFWDPRQGMQRRKSDTRSPSIPTQSRMRLPCLRAGAATTSAILASWTTEERAWAYTKWESGWHQTSSLSADSKACSDFPDRSLYVLFKLVFASPC